MKTKIIIKKVVDVEIYIFNSNIDIYTVDLILFLHSNIEKAFAV